MDAYRGDRTAIVTAGAFSQFETKGNKLAETFTLNKWPIEMLAASMFVCFAILLFPVSLVLRRAYLAATQSSSTKTSDDRVLFVCQTHLPKQTTKSQDQHSTLKHRVVCRLSLDSFLKRHSEN